MPALKRWKYFTKWSMTSKVIEGHIRQPSKYAIFAHFRPFRPFQGKIRPYLLCPFFIIDCLIFLNSKKPCIKCPLLGSRRVLLFIFILNMEVKKCSITWDLRSNKYVLNHSCISAPLNQLVQILLYIIPKYIKRNDKLY